MSGTATYAEVVASGIDGMSEASSNGSTRKHTQQHNHDLASASNDDFPPDKPYRTSIKEAPVTFERIPYIPREGDPLIDPGTARAVVAASNDAPNGTEDGKWNEKHEGATVLQQHVIYWDPDADGVIWPQDTYSGIRAWGWSIPLSLIAAVIIHFGLSLPTSPTFPLPDPFFRISIPRIHKAKHGSDSMSYDNEGRFRPQNFEDFFSKYDRDNKGGLNIQDLLRAWNGQRMVFDFFGWTATFLEWLATYLLIWPEDGIVRKEEARRVFDGSIFQYKADQYAEKQRKEKERKERVRKEKQHQKKLSGGSKISLKLF
ncbi:hypothetical protein H2199_003824 [Coniosporium tulheliwenetii]|uniref:Uncharacterized protein n=1 Tax=Coniosporium tulheliwenetii TaxID=3383036 RepID=A0ACC2Z9K6_9PEZI|nr:hypothetical protein H2199_003824 [Cladosporium sp. JES 115]